LNKSLQIINDEILCYKQSISFIEDKINLLKFLDSVDNSFGQNINLHNQKLLDEKKQLENNLNQLFKEQLKLTANDSEESVDGFWELSGKPVTTLQVNNYLAFIHNLSNDLETTDKKDKKNG